MIVSYEYQAWDYPRLVVKRKIPVVRFEPLYLHNGETAQYVAINDYEIVEDEYTDPDRIEAMLAILTAEDQSDV